MKSVPGCPKVLWVHFIVEMDPSGRGTDRARGADRSVGGVRLSLVMNRVRKPLYSDLRVSATQIDLVYVEGCPHVASAR